VSIIGFNYNLAAHIFFSASSSSSSSSSSLRQELNIHMVTHGCDHQIFFFFFIAAAAKIECSHDHPWQTPSL
jgi:hypothetical protein